MVFTEEACRAGTTRDVSCCQICPRKGSSGQHVHVTHQWRRYIVLLQVSGLWFTHLPLPEMCSSPSLWIPTFSQGHLCAPSPCGVPELFWTLGSLSSDNSVFYTWISVLMLIVSLGSELPKVTPIGILIVRVPTHRETQQVSEG